MHMRSYFASLLALLLASPAFAVDKVSYKNRQTMKDTFASGDVRKETPVEVEIFNDTTGLRKIPTGDVIDVTYDLEDTQIPELKAGRTAERGKKFDEALKSYEAGLKKVPVSKPFIRAYFQHKAARMKVELADAGSLEHRALAVEALKEFRTKYPDARQIVDCLKTLSRVDAGATQEVRDSFARLKQTYGTNKELAAECDLFDLKLLVQEAQGLLKTKPDEAKTKYAEAEGRLKPMLADAPGNLELVLSLTECLAGQGKYDEGIDGMKKLLATAKDDPTLATAHLGRGDCHRMKAMELAKKGADVGATNQELRKAMWDYLWVDVVYNKEPEQNARALYHLYEVFKELKETERAAECRDRLKKDFSGNRYEKLLN